MSLDRISLAQPTLDGNERKYVLDCLDTNWISSIGKYIGAFEERFADFCGVEHAIATNNGTTALHLAVVGMGVEPGDEILVPTLTYIATANVVRYCGAVPVFVDSSPNALNIDPEQLAQHVTDRTRGVIPVHLYGQPADMRKISEFCKENGLWSVEDAAEAHGAGIEGKRVGGWGHCATFSFFGNKIITTGEGGIVTTDDPELAQQLRLLRGQGMDPDRRYWFPVIGYNYRMTNIQAAIGLAQLETIDRAIEARSEIASWYDEFLCPLGDEITTVADPPWAQSVVWVYNVFLRDGGETERDAAMAGLDELGIETRPVFYPMHVLPPYREEATYPHAERWARSGITLPTHQGLSRLDVERVARSLEQTLRNR